MLFRKTFLPLCRKHFNKNFKTMRIIHTTSLTLNESNESRKIVKMSVSEFFKTEPEFTKKLNQDFALPYADLNNYGSPETPTTSSLYDFYAKGCIARPTMDMKYYTEDFKSAEENIKVRRHGKSVDVIKTVVEPFKRLKKIEGEISKYEEMRENLKSEKHSTQGWENLGKRESSELYFIYCRNILKLLKYARKEVEKFYLINSLSLPNKTHPDSPRGNHDDDCDVIETIGRKPEFEFKVYDHIEIAEKLKIFRESQMSDFAGHRSHFLVGKGAELEQALIRFTLDRLKMRGFTFISTPTMLKSPMFEGAGLMTDKMDDMIYKLDSGDFCLSGTSEVGLCSYFSSHATPQSQLPLKVCSVSSCFRRETGTRNDPRGLFRVHEFNKVEMFGIAANEDKAESENLFREFVDIQKEIFSDLGLHFKVVDMPTGQLGSPAYRKSDILCWFPGRNRFDEVSSASNCTDYQSRRLSILYKRLGDYRFAHTVNATACAVPRLIVALLENGQQSDKTVRLPDCLVPYMGVSQLGKERHQVEYVGMKQSKKKQRRIDEYDS